MRCGPQVLRMGARMANSLGLSTQVFARPPIHLSEQTTVNTKVGLILRFVANPEVVGATKISSYSTVETSA